MVLGRWFEGRVGTEPHHRLEQCFQSAAARPPLTEASISKPSPTQISHGNHGVLPSATFSTQNHTQLLSWLITITAQGAPLPSQSFNPSIYNFTSLPVASEVLFHVSFDYKVFMRL